MGRKSRAAADRMMRALSLCDSQGIHTAVRRYLDKLNVGELETLLRASLKDLDSYHRMQLESVLNAGSSGDVGGLRRLFASFVAQNPRSLEQLSPAMIEGVLRQTVIEDRNLGREFCTASRRRYGTLVSGLSGALCAVFIFFGYVHFHSQDRMREITVPPTLAVRVHTQRPVIQKIARRTAPSVSVRHAGQPVKRRRVHQRRESIGHNAAQPSARTTHALVATRAVPVSGRKTAAPLTALPPVAHLAPTGIVQTQVFPKASRDEDAYMVEQTAVDQRPSDASVSASQPPTSTPVKYCFDRGTWRTC